MGASAIELRSFRHGAEPDGSTELPGRRMRRPVEPYCFLMVEEPLISRLDALLKADPVLPPEGMQAADIEELPRRAIGLGGVEHEIRAWIHNLADHLGKFPYAEVLPCPDIDVRLVFIVFHEEPARAREVIDV
tara:strand:+ start:119 stop:517 length:399 start_codon:yes stop_codon:yes gene_type:complete